VKSEKRKVRSGKWKVKNECGRKAHREIHTKVLREMPFVKLPLSDSLYPTAPKGREEKFSARKSPSGDLGVLHEYFC